MLRCCVICKSLSPLCSMLQCSECNALLWNVWQVAVGRAGEIKWAVFMVCVVELRYMMTVLLICTWKITFIFSTPIFDALIQYLIHTLHFHFQLILFFSSHSHQFLHVGCCPSVAFTCTTSSSSLDFTSAGPRKLKETYVFPRERTLTEEYRVKIEAPSF